MKYVLTLLIVVLFNAFVKAQSNTGKIIVNLLENDDITLVNIENQAAFIDSLKRIFDVFEQKTASYEKSQKIGLLVTAHKAGPTTFQLYSNPTLAANKQKELLHSIEQVQLGNTLLLDFPIFIALHCDKEFGIEDFPEFLPPREKRLRDYQLASIKDKVRLNREMAINEGILVLMAFQFKTDEKFKGVRKFAKTLKAMNFNEYQYVELQTARNTDYWRACLEMAPGNQLIPASMIYLYVSQNEFDIAKHYMNIVHPFSDEKTVVHRYIEEMKWRLEVFYKELNAEIQKGIKLHDEGKYAAAIAQYDQILAAYPNSAWAIYEKYFSQNSLNIQKNLTKAGDFTLWNQTKELVFKHDPLFATDVLAKNGKEAYQLFIRKQIQTLFTDKDQMESDLNRYGLMTLDLDYYAFSAQLFCLKVVLDQGKDTQQKDINYFLYNLEKLVVQDIKQNFKGDFEKIFADIQLERENTMKESAIYKAFKN